MYITDAPEIVSSQLDIATEWQYIETSAGVQVFLAQSRKLFTRNCERSAVYLAARKPGAWNCLELVPAFRMKRDIAGAGFIQFTPGNSSLDRSGSSLHQWTD